MIREVTQAHLANCAQVIRESFATVADAFGFTPENAPGFTAFATTENTLRHHLLEEHRPMYALFHGESVVGYYSLKLLQQHRWELNHLCVHPAHRHQGIGETLLMHAFQTAKALGCRTLAIGIVEENQVLRKWYESFGFVHTGTRKSAAFPFTIGFMEKPLD